MTSDPEARAVPSPTRSLAWDLLPTGVDSRLRSLHAVDARIAWAAGAHGTVLRTVDHGRTWRLVGPKGADGLQFRSIQAFDADYAVVMSFGASDAARILVTTDGGEHWTETFRNTDPHAFYDCMTFHDRLTGLAVADPVDGRFRVLGTSDGGRNWSVVDPSGMPPALEGEAAFAASGTCLVARDGKYWFATGSAERARVFRSGDLGRTWTVANTPVRTVRDAGIFALAFRNATEGIAVGGDYTDQNRPGQLLAVTRDAGATWRLCEEQPPAAYRSGARWTGREFIAVGPSGSDASFDGGLTWVPFDTTGLDTVSTGTDNSCWAAGEHGRVARLVSPRT
ncbi:WD40/YVTN/BNR-like repeat-containing protein [Streptomyces sp. NPDC059785]|uniref:WD40/YVTN/BNR-like repeat-containing protein n=1 Tax=unclassified Streptomyces TaxID=2593676 RepID=UPI00364885F4